jgi:hypothetical protein
MYMENFILQFFDTLKCWFTQREQMLLWAKVNIPKKMCLLYHCGCADGIDLSSFRRSEEWTKETPWRPGESENDGLSRLSSHIVAGLRRPIVIFPHRIGWSAVVAKDNFADLIINYLQSTEAVVHVRPVRRAHAHAKSLGDRYQVRIDQTNGDDGRR